MIYAIDVANGHNLKNPIRKYNGWWGDVMVRSADSAETKADDEEVIAMPCKGTRKPSTRGERRKANFRHLSEREKKRLRQAKGWDARSWDKYPFWGEETIQERKGKERALSALRDGDYMEEIKAEEERKRFLESERQMAKGDILSIEAEIKRLQDKISYLKFDLAMAVDYYNSLK